MMVIICAKYKNNPSRTVDATEWTRLSKSRPNDLEDIGQGQGSSHTTHPLMQLIICTKYGKNPSWTVDATEWTRDAGRMDGRTDWVKPIYPQQFRCVGGVELQEHGLLTAYHVHIWQVLPQHCFSESCQTSLHFADDYFKCIFLNKNVSILIKISLKFVTNGLINNTLALVQIMAWRQPGDKPISEPMMVRLPMHIWVTQPQWVNLKNRI